MKKEKILERKDKDTGGKGELRYCHGVQISLCARAYVAESGLVKGGGGDNTITSPTSS